MFPNFGIRSKKKVESLYLEQQPQQSGKGIANYRQVLKMSNFLNVKVSQQYMNIAKFNLKKNQITLFLKEQEHRSQKQIQ